MDVEVNVGAESNNDVVDRENFRVKPCHGSEGI
jgi:hypothetical protein